MYDTIPFTGNVRDREVYGDRVAEGGEDGECLLMGTVSLWGDDTFWN